MIAVVSQRPTAPAPESGVRVRSISELVAALDDAEQIADALAWAEGMLARVRACAGDGTRFVSGMR
jgi:hypothetical protein